MSGRLLLVLAPLLTGGCSLVLDFDDPPAPPDAMQADAIPPSACEFGEDNQTRALAHPLTPVSGELGGICELGDHDFYSFNVTDGQVLVAEILFGQTGSRGDLDMRIYDVDGTVV